MNFVSLLTLFAAFSLAKQTPDPRYDAQVYFLIDATVGVDRGYCLSMGTVSLAEQLVSLAQAFADKGLVLEVAVSGFGSASGTCFIDEMLPHFTTNMTLVQEHMYAVPVVDQEKELVADRNTWNAIMHVASGDYFRKDRFTRRVVVLLTDVPPEWESGNPENPWVQPHCPQALPSAAQFAQVMQENEMGFLVVSTSFDQLLSELVRGDTRKKLNKIGLNDIALDSAAMFDSWDAVENQLTLMLSNSFMQSTTTTTTVKPKTYNLKVDRDAQVYFLIDGIASDVDNQPSASVQWSINQLEYIFDAYEAAGYKLEIGAASFGETKVCFKQLFDWTTDYRTVRVNMVNPPRYDASKGSQANPNTANAIMAFLQNYPFRTAESTRRVIVVLCDKVGKFGKGNDGDFGAAQCPTEHPTAEAFTKAIESHRVGLIFSMKQSTKETAQTSHDDAVKIIQPTGLTDMQIDDGYDKKTWDGVTYHLARFLSADYIATTTVKPLRDIVQTCYERCVQEQKICTA